MVHVFILFTYCVIIGVAHGGQKVTSDPICEPPNVVLGSKL